MSEVFRSSSLIVVIMTLFSVSLGAQEQTKRLDRPSMTYFVKIETNRGDFTIGLYDDTPIHRDNFLELVRSKAYEGVLFHRVISRFMVQTGNLSTKNATKNTDVNVDSTQTRLPAEIMPEKIFHKRGTVAAARIGNEQNPLKESSQTQFYITTGTFFTDWDLDDFERISGRTLTEFQREAYKTQGGVPALDGEYTVFGEVVEGLDTIRRIEEVKTDDKNRPKRNIVIKKASIVEKPLK